MKFLDFRSGRLFEGGRLLTFWAFRARAYWKVGGQSNKCGTAVRNH